MCQLTIFTQMSVEMTCKIEKIKTDYYLPEIDELTKFDVDQTVVIKEEYLKFISKYKRPQTKRGLDDLSIPYDWHPYVNSYYPYTEDVDAFARVNHLLGSKPSFASLSSTDSRTQYDTEQEKVPYSESAAQLRYLETNPFSFIILGKPDIGQQELGKRLADYWQCVYIDPHVIIEQEIMSGSRAGQCIEFNLRCGRAIGIDVILRLVEKRVKSESAKHRGFVLCDLPLIPNDLYQEDPISSESAVFTVKEVFEEMFEISMKSVPIYPSKPHASISSKFKSEDELVDDDISIEKGSVEEEMEGEGVELPPKRQPVQFTPIEIPIDTGPDYDVCQTPEIGTNFEDQLNFIFNLMQHPFMIIYIMCSTTDVVEKRRNYRFDVYSKQTINLQTELYNNLLYNYISQQENANEEILEDFLETDYIHMDTTHLNYLIKLPRHFPANVSTQLDSYHYIGLHFIERRVLMHDPQYFLKVDGRVSIQRMFHIIKARLKILPIQQVILPSRLSEEPIDFGEEGHNEIKSLETFYRELSTKQVPGNTFKWNWSDWGTHCPVALKEGILKKGDAQYVLHFMNKIFFLGNEENFFKFYRNPRPYLLPPNPRPTCKIFVFGPKLSGKTAASLCLSYLLNGTVLSIESMLAIFLMNQEEEMKEKAKQTAIAEALKILNEQRAEEAKKLEAERIEKIKEWVASTKRLIEDVIAMLVEMSKDQTVTSFEISSFPMAMKKVSLIESENSQAILFIQLKEQIHNLRIPFSYKIDDWHAMLKEKRKLLMYLPAHLRSRVVPKPATVFDDFVVEYARNAVEHTHLHDTSINNKSLANIMINHIKATEDERVRQGHNRGGWILDGVLCDTVIMDELYPNFIADEIIVLLDEEEPNFLVDRYRKEGETDLEDYRDFFMSIGKFDAAWRSPSKNLKKSDTPNLIRQILSDIINDPNVFNYEDGGRPDKAAAYRQDVLSFYEKWDEIKKYFLERNIVPIEIKVTHKSIPDLMKEVILEIEDRYRVKASPFTELDRAEEVKNFGNQMLQKNISEGFGEDEVFEKNRRYGDTYHFCPVTFHDKWVLWKGKEDYAVKFENKLYLLSGVGDMNKFLHNPRNYLTGVPPEEFPPPRICVVGIPGTGKTSVAKALANNYGLTYVNFQSVLQKFFGTTVPRSLNTMRNDENVHVALLAYLNEDVPLPDDLFKNIISKFWLEKPIRGFVIDDFPKRPSDLKLMTEHKLIPDIILNLTNNFNKTKMKLIKDQLALWEIEINKRRLVLEKENEMVLFNWEERRKTRFEELIEEKREQRYAQKRKNKEESLVQPPMSSPHLKDIKEEGDTDRSGFRTESQVSFDSVAEQDDIREVNDILDAELPEPVFGNTLETVDDATDRFDALATDTINVEGGFLKNIKGICALEEIVFTDIAVHFDDPELTVRNAFFVSDKYKFRTKSHFERCYDVSFEVAERLLSCGYFFLSKFGKTCPVQYYEDSNPIQMYMPMQQRNSLFPVIHRSYIYYLGGSENCAKFKEDPIKYISVESFNAPLITLRVAVIGPPKCGKTVLASRITREFDFKLISRGQAARYVLTYLPLSDLAKTMESVLRKGWELTDEMVMKCVEAASFDVKAVTQGRSIHDRLRMFYIRNIIEDIN